MRTRLLSILLLAAAACSHDPVAPPAAELATAAPAVPAPPAEAVATEAVAPAAQPPAAPADHGGAAGAIRLNGEETKVRWSDGDSFDIESGPHAGAGTRLIGFNALESYGPVHRWGAWKPAELSAIARTSKELANAEVWACTSDGKKDGYGRLLIACPGAGRALVRAGHAFVMAVDEEPDAELLKAQAAARAAKAGMWAKGAPTEIVSSVHPSEGGKPSYNRVVNVETGRSRKWSHQSTYQICEEVCLPDGSSCLVYVPFDRRYKAATRADCLK